MGGMKRFSGGSLRQGRMPAFPGDRCRLSLVLTASPPGLTGGMAFTDERPSLYQRSERGLDG
jgi:hypothetical protein